MAGLQKVKLSAPKGVLSGSPRRSPAAHLRRRQRKTLKMLLDSPDRRQSPSNSSGQRVSAAAVGDAPRGLRPRRKLKDILASPPQLEQEEANESCREWGVMSETAPVSTIGGFSLRRRFSGSLRPSSTGFRHRLMIRRVWRPVLVTIPE